MQGLQMTRLAAITFLAATAALVATVALPSSAQAFFRVGGDVRWVPVAEEVMSEEGDQYDPVRQLPSMGVSGRAIFGFTYFSVGARAALTRHSFADSELDFTQIDLNAQVRSAMPWTRVRFYLEGGPSMSLDLSEVGWNGGTGVEVDLLGWPLLDLNLGIGAQYAHVFIGTGATESRINSGLRGMVTLGADFTLIK